MSGLYLDASAITKLVIDEPETASLQELVRGRLLATSRVVVVEVRKAVVRANPEADAQAILALLSFVELDGELATLAGGTGGPSLRASDAIHIASALRLGPAIDSFVTYDTRQAAAAGAAGLRIQAPAG